MGPQQETMEFDVLNLNTFDEYDWVIFIFIIMVFGGLCLMIGWCAHKQCVHNKVYGNSDDDIAVFTADGRSAHRTPRPTNNGRTAHSIQQETKLDKIIEIKLDEKKIKKKYDDFSPRNFTPGV